MTIQEVPERPDLDEQYVHTKPMSGMAASLFGIPVAYARGSQAAIEDTRRRQREAQKQAHKVLKEEQ